ncbi:hypothetical protein H4582DRAFT_1779670, partial [Lactarius indigo]
MDEKGCQHGGGGGGLHEKVFVGQTQWDAYEGGSNNLDLITIIECVSAVGNCIKPGFIFSGSSQFHQGWLEGLNIRNGWTDNFLCTEWFTKGFIPQAIACNKTGKPVLLI